MTGTTKKSVNRYFNGIEKMRLIVSVEKNVVDEINSLIKYSTFGLNHPAKNNRSEFVRLAIKEKLERDRKNGR